MNDNVKYTIKGKQVNLDKPDEITNYVEKIVIKGNVRQVRTDLMREDSSDTK